MRWRCSPPEADPGLRSRGSLPAVQPARRRAPLPPALQALRAHQRHHHHQPRLQRMAGVFGEATALLDRANNAHLGRLVQQQAHHGTHRQHAPRRSRGLPTVLASLCILVAFNRQYIDTTIGYLYCQSKYYDVCPLHSNGDVYGWSAS
jgi:hypothetical protein